MVSEAQYITLSEGVKDKYEARITAYLTGVAKLFREQGWAAGPVMDLCADEWEWAIQVNPDPQADLKGDRRTIAIEFEIAESLQYGDGTTGVSFRIDLNGMGGWVIGGLAPYNYTSDCWVPIDDEDAVETRFSIVENSDFTELFNTCANWTPPGV
jgi:hypothetical protein